jgi:hypothetical protein
MSLHFHFAIVYFIGTWRNGVDYGEVRFRLYDHTHTEALGVGSHPLPTVNLIPNLGSASSAVRPIRPAAFSKLEYPPCHGRYNAIECIISARPSIKYNVQRNVGVFRRSQYWAESDRRIPPGMEGKQQACCEIDFIRITSRAKNFTSLPNLDCTEGPRQHHSRDIS